jgi:hypothetical protein
LSGNGAVPRWKKVYVVVVFFVLVVPLFLVIVYPAITGTSANSALGQVIAYYNSPPLVIFWIFLIVLVWVLLFQNYGSFGRFSRRPAEAQ